MIIRGTPVGLYVPRPDYAQDDPTALDYIKNKPDALIQNAQDTANRAEAAAKKAAEDSLNNAGGTMSGAINMDGNKISNLPQPEVDTDPATKQYVDAKHFVITVNLLAANWNGDTAPYSQTVEIESILETDAPTYGVVYSADIASKLKEKEAFAMVDDLDTANGIVTFTCFEEKPEIDLSVQMEVNR